MENLDLNIALDIAARGGRDSVADLASMLSSSTYYRFLSAHSDVLKTVSLQPFIENAARWNLLSTARPIFARCLEDSYPSGVYLESLRLAASKGRAEEGFHMLRFLQAAQPTSFPHAAMFTLSLFENVLGIYDDGISSSHGFVDFVGSDAAADTVATSVYRQIL
ncbi:hypothetical protein AXX17_AT2G05490 [Arabidopsis thaliana]|uniref:Uncharacterized protein n=1 Tax=Arabidopsis thaliana TaxID=3702 RepID=A0A178W0Q9_ARATH|nr:hypothetical protein AXX17_AT2G05490 [Arabidopsis thaliana]